MNSFGSRASRAKPRPAIAAVILVAERHTAIGEADQSAVRDGDAVCIAGEPVPRRRALALGVMAVATGVVGDPAVAAVLTALDMAAEGRRAAALDC